MDADDERDFRMKADPETFFITDHYRGYPTVLVRLTSVTTTDLRDVLEQAETDHGVEARVHERQGAGEGVHECGAHCRAGVPRKPARLRAGGARGLRGGGTDHPERVVHADDRGAGAR